MMAPILSKLTGFVGKRTRIERRAFRRLTPGHLTPCHVSIPGTDATRPAWVQNLSVRGAGIVTNRECLVGTQVQLLLVNSAHTFALAISMDIVRCFRVLNGNYFIGGRFTRQLRHDELLPFMI